MSFYREYRSTLKVIESEEFFDLMLFRPLGFLFVKGIQLTRITPDQITVLSAVLFFTAAWMIGRGVTELVFVAGLLIALGNVLDCADGQLARIKGNGSVYGRILDGVGDYLSAGAVFIGIGVWGSGLPVDPIIWWFVIFLTMISYGWQASLVDYYRNEFIARLKGKTEFTDSELAEASVELERLKRDKRAPVLRFFLSSYIAYSRIQTAFQSPFHERIPVSPVRYLEANAIMIRLWCLNGSATPRFLLIVFCLMNRLDLYIGYVLLMGSMWSLLLFWAQKVVDLNLVREQKC